MSTNELADAIATRDVTVTGVRIRKATVTNNAPVTVTYADGTSVASIPYDYSYYPIINDVVNVMFDGAASFIMGLVPGASPWHSFQPGAFTAGVGNHGNASFDGIRFKVTDLICTYEGRFIFGSTTSYTGGIMILPLPISTSAAGNFPAIFGLSAYDASRAEHWSGWGEAPASASSLGLYGTSANALIANTWNYAGSPSSRPFTAGDGWTTSDEIKWFVQYPVDPL